MKYKYYAVKDPIYRWHLSLFVGDRDAIKKYLVDKCDIPEETVGEINTGKFIPYKKYTIIVIPEFNIPTLVHELIHLAFAVMDRAGIPIEMSNDETITYYVEMMMELILKKMNKQIKVVPLKK
jgi:hypothetical protein